MAISREMKTYVHTKTYTQIFKAIFLGHGRFYSFLSIANQSEMPLKFTERDEFFSYYESKEWKLIRTESY